MTEVNEKVDLNSRVNSRINKTRSNPGIIRWTTVKTQPLQNLNKNLNINLHTNSQPCPSTGFILTPEIIFIKYTLLKLFRRGHARSTLQFDARKEFLISDMNF